MRGLQQLGVIGLMAAVGACSVGCARRPSPGDTGHGGASPNAGPMVTIGLSLRGLDATHAALLQDGAERAKADLSSRGEPAELRWDGAARGAEGAAPEVVSGWIAGRIDVICVAPEEPRGWTSVAEAARSAGTRLVTLVEDLPDSGRALFVKPWDEAELGRVLMDTLAAEMGDTGRFAAVTLASSSPSTTALFDAIEARLAEAYPDMSMGRVEFPRQSTPDPKVAVDALLAQYAAIGGVLALDPRCLKGAAEAIEARDASGKIRLTGVGGPNTVSEHLERGTIRHTVFWRPADVGYAAVILANELARGRPIAEGAPIKGLDPLAYDAATQVATVSKPVVWDSSGDLHKQAGPDTTHQEGRTP